MATRPETKQDDAKDDRPVSVADSDTLVQDEESQAGSIKKSLKHKPPSDSVPGYETRQCLGEGAYGSVWLANEHSTGKQVAIKFYTHRRGLDWSLLNREVEKLAVLYTSRNIVGLIDVGWNSDPPYYVMEYLEKGSLESYLADGPLPPHEAVEIAKSVLQALVHAHGSGILHCDLKPANVLLDSDYQPRLCDFGQSRLSNEQNPALGTLFYMAPEQADLNAVPDARWDVYALGALLYHLLSGAPPYRDAEAENRLRAAENLEERLAIYREIVTTSTPPTHLRHTPGIDKRLADIVDRCLKADPERRYRNAQAVLDVLTLRDRYRARRPLIALGVLAPALLLIALMPFAQQIIRKAVQTAQVNVVERALESDVLSVNLLASSLEQELDSRMFELQEIAQQRELRLAVQNAATTQWADRSKLISILDQEYADITKKRRTRGRKVDKSWFFCDAEGFQRWRHQRSQSWDQNWAHRDYWHGRNESYEKGKQPQDITPLKTPHISLAYRGLTEQRYKVAISVPVWDVDGQNVIGVLARTSELGALLAEYEKNIHRNGEGRVTRLFALIDQRDGKLLDHPWIRRIREQEAADEITKFEKLRLTGAVKEKLDRLGKYGPDAAGLEDDERESTYLDPVRNLDSAVYGGQWLAAFSPVRQTRWIAVVQEPKTEALQPVDELERELNQYFWLALVTCCALIGGLWFFVLRAFNDRGLRTWSRARTHLADSTTSST